MIIACGYKKLSGKDTSLKLAKELFPNKHFVRVAFADPLKQEFYEIVLKPNGLSKDLIDNPITKPSLRGGVQWYGTEFARNPLLGGYENKWVDMALEQVQRILEENPNAIPWFCDLRFLNELHALKKVKAKCINIVRKSVQDLNDNHISETALDDYLNLFDYTILNDGTMEEYKEKIKQMLNEIFEEHEREKKISE